MKNFHGIIMYEDGETPELPLGLSHESDIKSKYGFRILVEDGKPQWIAANFDDFLFSESTRLGMKIEDLRNSENEEMLGGCDQIGPTQCSSENGFCWASTCKLLFNPDTQHYYCKCA